MRKIIFSLFFCLAILVVIEIILRLNLFSYVSYSNSESIDQQLIDRNKSNKWNILFVGDSETRWGVDPRQIDTAFQQKNSKVYSFNHAFDGFGASWWPVLLPGLLKEKSLENVEFVAVGVQMISGHSIIQPANAGCGALQKPVLTSSFGIDLGLESLCGESKDWEQKLSKEMFGWLWLARYSSAVHTLIMPSFMSMDNENKLRFNSAKFGEPVNGFAPHSTIESSLENYSSEFARWKAQANPERDFVPLKPEIWTNMVKKNGFFDQLNSLVSANDKKLVLFALPTNPTLIDVYNRREDYFRNSKLLSEWATDRGIVFVDLGIQDVQDSNKYFSDMRHLSWLGAEKFSRALGEKLAERIDLETKK